MIRNVLIALGWLGPLLFWALAARTRRVGVPAAVSLVLIAVAQCVVTAAWVFHDVAFTLAACLAVLADVLVIAGLVREAKVPSGLRSRIGRIIAGFFCFLPTTLALLLFVLRPEGPVYVPSANYIMPLPAGLTVAKDLDQGCSPEGCVREIDVTGPAGASADDVMRRIAQALKDRDGWDITPNRDPECRTVGYLLDRQTLCVGVDDQQGTVGIYLRIGL